MAEIAAAMDAQVVVSATLGVVESQLVLQLSVFDVKAARSGGRRMLRSSSMTTLLGETESATHALLAPLLAPSSSTPPAPSATPAPSSTTTPAPAPAPAPVRTRVLVLDVVMPAASTPAEAAAPPPEPGFVSRLGWWSVGGGAGVVAGGVGVGGGAFAVVTARTTAQAAFDKTLRPAASRALTARAETLGGVAVGLLVGGGVLLLGGASVIVWDGVTE
jgi:hypothetical protein